MTPTREELLEGSTRWRKSHKGVSIILSHHGYNNGENGISYHPGIWCYYLQIPEQMYPHRWSDFACTRHESGFETHGPAFEHEMFDTEITFAASKPYWGRKEQRLFDGVEVGCDYAHLWHSESGYPDSYISVTSDAIATVEAFIAAHPDRKIRCGYSDEWADAKEFYIAENGQLVHEARKPELEMNSGWTTWLPVSEATHGAGKQLPQECMRAALAALTEEYKP